MVDLAGAGHRGVMLVTGAGSGDGTTTVLVNVGVVLASATRPVLLIDGNLYRPRLHTVFGLSNEVGLTSVLANRASLTEAIQRAPGREGVLVLTSGPVDVDPAELLSKVDTRNILTAAAIVAPVILMDGPPLLSVTGGVILAGLTSSVIVVVRAGHTSRTELASALDLVERTGTPILGVVLNDVAGEQTDEYRTGRARGPDHGDVAQASQADLHPPRGRGRRGRGSGETVIGSPVTVP
ncbi:MAG: CpsD/CapB family tyrosine-protein kinase [Nocardioidaceae bacterium]|nr:CpsD/CapB family tyrosine-protein kinase [Nocardioidaceae bacterium]